MSTFNKPGEVIAEYLAASLEEGTDVFLEALATVARARGMTQLARDCGLGRESLYKALSPGSKPRFDTIMKITRALGVPLAPDAGGYLSTEESDAFMEKRLVGVTENAHGGR